MRTLLFILGGFVLLAACLGAAKYFTANFAETARTAIIGFLALWLIVAGVNMWFGVAKAGYSAREEFPIFLLIFGLPVVTAIILKRKFL